MASSTTTTTVTSVILAVAMTVILAAFAVVAAGTTGEKPIPSTQAPTPGPTGSLDQGVILDVADDHEVIVVIANASDSVVGARTGRAADGMSVRWGEVDVVNVDEDTLRLTWSGWLVDETVTMAVAADGDGLIVTITQKLPGPNTDAMGGDRVVEIDLAQPVNADDVRTEVVTAG